MKFMKNSLILFVFVSLLFACNSSTEQAKETVKATMEEKTAETKQLRHVVLFKFKKGTAKEDIQKVEAAFSALPSKIPQIKAYEWGTNNSPEGLDKGFTHCFFLTFESVADRAIYLPHPDHKAFGDVLTPHLDDVLVLDYWVE